MSAERTRPSVDAELKAGQTRNLIIATLASVMGFWAWTIIGPLSSRYSQAMDLTAGQTSILVAMPILVGSVARVPVGALTDRYGGRVMFTAILGVTAPLVLLTAIVGQMNSFGLLVFVSFFLGIAGTVFAIGIPFCSAWYEAHRKGFATGVFGAGMVGTAVSAFVTPRIVAGLGYMGAHVLIAVLVATPLALLIASWQGLRNAVGPLISGMQVLPSVAWVPAAIVWFGLSDATVYFVVLMGAIPSIVNGMLAGVDQIPPQLLKAGRIMGATGSTLALKVVLPAAMPGYVAGLKQGWAFSWRSLMGAELIAIGGSIGFGLGSLLAQGRTVSDMAVVLTAVLTILAVGIVIELLLFNPLEKRLLRGRGLLRS